MKKYMVLALTLTFLAAPALYAHDLFVGKQAGEFVVLFGHTDTGKFSEYKTEHIKEVRAYDKSGNAIAAQLKPHAKGAAVVAGQNPALIALVFDRGFTVKTTEGYKNVSKREAQNVIESWKGATYNKNIWQWSDRFAKPLGGKIEIVPLKNPLTLKVGDILPFQVFYDGKPIEGLEIGTADHSDQKGIVTDKNGKASVSIKKSGQQVVKATRKIPLQNDPDVDFLRESATIAFEVK
jgi:nickel transport protein